MRSRRTAIVGGRAIGRAAVQLGAVGCGELGQRHRPRARRRARSCPGGTESRPAGAPRRSRGRATGTRGCAGRSGSPRPAGRAHSCRACSWMSLATSAGVRPPASTSPTKGTEIMPSGRTGTVMPSSGIAPDRHLHDVVDADVVGLDGVAVVSSGRWLPLTLPLDVAQAASRVTTQRASRPRQYATFHVSPVMVTLLRTRALSLSGHFAAVPRIRSVSNRVEVPVPGDEAGARRLRSAWSGE